MRYPFPSNRTCSRGAHARMTMPVPQRWLDQRTWSGLCTGLYATALPTSTQSRPEPECLRHTVLRTYAVHTSLACHVRDSRKAASGCAGRASTVVARPQGHPAIPGRRRCHGCTAPPLILFAARLPWDTVTLASHLLNRAVDDGLSAQCTRAMSTVGSRCRLRTSAHVCARLFCRQPYQLCRSPLCCRDREYNNAGTSMYTQLTTTSHPQVRGLPGRDDNPCASRWTCRRRKPLRRRPRDSTSKGHVPDRGDA